MRRRIPKPAAFSPALRRLGLATPPPFVGRASELEALARSLEDALVLVVHGALGAGKTRLASRLAEQPELCGGLRPAQVTCRPGDRAGALRARAERALDALPGTLDAVLRDEPRLLIIDDAHNLPRDEAAHVLYGMVREPGVGRVLLLTRDVLPLRRSDARRFEMSLQGLDESSARELWAHLEEIYGPTPAGACDAALTRTRGMPLALRREYARAAVGAAAWSVETLAEDVRRALEAIAVVRLPVAPAAVAALAPEIDVEPALIELVSRQLIDPLEDGRFSVHDVVREEALAAMDDGARAELERAAAELISSVGASVGGRRRLAWNAGDDGAIGLVDPIDRAREAVLHLVAAGDAEAAAERLVGEREAMLRRGAGGEVLALVDLLDEAGVPALAKVRGEIAARHGRVAEALEHGGTGDPVDDAELLFRSGDVAGASATLARMCEGDDAELRCRAAAALAEIEIDRGRCERASALATGAFERDRAEAGDRARARLHVALAAIEQRAGRATSARAALSRAASSGRLGEPLAADVEARRALCLAHEGRLSEAGQVLDAAEELAREVDTVAVAEELGRCRAVVRSLAGDAARASSDLRDLVSRRRERGDEIGALRVEIDLARILERRGELAAAGELVGACTAAATRRDLGGLAARAELVGAAIDAAEHRIEDVRGRLTKIVAGGAADGETRAGAAALLEQTSAGDGSATGGPIAAAGEPSCRAALAALSAGDAGVALDIARKTAVRAERAGRSGEMVEALALVARLELARGDKAVANAAATRAAREALASGFTRARAQALLVLAALARDEGDVKAAAVYAQDAAAIATGGGLPVERLAAAQALEVIAAGEQGRAAAAEIHSAAAATMSATAMEAAARLLADLGLTAARPFRVVGPAGEESFVADASPDLLRMNERDLAVDGVREIIFRSGKQVADLRRRSLLKRLLFLFAAAPGQIFSKEDIVQTVWSVEYHPLRHDAALFTNIMRIRRLLGKDGADLIRVGEDGYRFCPPRDFVFVEAIGKSA